MERSITHFTAIGPMKMKTENEIQEINCPACAHPNTFEPVSVIKKGTLEQKELFKGNINKVNCSSCSRNFLVEIPLIYRDDSKHYLIYNIAVSEEEQLEDLIEQVDTLYRMTYEDFGFEDKPKCRLTTSRRDFIEKIAIQQQGYDDRLIEYIKYQLFGHSKRGLDSSRMELLFDFTNSNAEHISFLAFERNTGKPLYSMEFLGQDYGNLERYFLGSQEMEKKLNQLFKKYYVNVDNLLG